MFTDTNCIDGTPLGHEENDVGDIEETYMPYHYCKAQGFTTYASYITDNANTDPDICKTNSSTNVTNPALRFDTSDTDVYTEITCFINDSLLGCTLPNALNYDPIVTRND